MRLSKFWPRLVIHVHKRGDSEILVEFEGKQYFLSDQVEGLQIIDKPVKWLGVKGWRHNELDSCDYLRLLAGLDVRIGGLQARLDDNNQAANLLKGVGRANHMIALLSLDVGGELEALRSLRNKLQGLLL